MVIENHRQILFQNFADLEIEKNVKLIFKLVIRLIDSWNS